MTKKKAVTDEFDTLREWIAEVNPQALLADGFEDALIGIVETPGNTIACYDYDACIEILVCRDEMSYEDAVEHMSFNVLGSYVGPDGPAFVTNMRRRLKDMTIGASREC